MARLRLSDSLQRTYQGTLVNSGLDGERVILFVSFTGDPRPILHMGEHVRLASLAGNLPADGDPCAARVVYQALESSRVTYQFVAGKEARSLVTQTRERRPAARVPPSADAPILVTCTTREGKVLRPVVNNISASGISLVFSPEDDRGIAGELRLALSIRLPGAGRFLRVDAIVVYRRLAQPGVICGMRFDDEAPGFAATRSLVQQYVAQRQASLTPRR